MTVSQAEAEAKRFRDLMPTVKPEQVCVLIEAALPYPLHVVQAVINAHARQNKFLDIPDVLRALRARCPKVAAAVRRSEERELARGSDSASRTTEEREAERKECLEIQQERAAIDEQFKVLTDERIEVLKAKAIERLPAEIRELHQRMNPRSNSLLKSLIVKLHNESMTAGTVASESVGFEKADRP